ncbi:MAG: DinB family protein [Cyclobacteriaceae bacterium]|nr:DinB family protein [Cyclobacteriaceae bacterium]
MKLTTACCNILEQLTGLVEQITPQDFSKPVTTLGNSTIGQHLRHTLEFFICLENGYEKGVVNYDKRQHDKLIESDKYIALSTLNRIKDFVATQQPDKPLQLEVGYDLKNDEATVVQTNFARELVYNIEHAVHHMAIMKIGIREVAPYVTLPAEFGIAASTIRYQEKTALASS